MQLTWASNSGSRTERLTDICAAWWQIASGRSDATTRSTAAASVMSATWSGTAAGRLSRDPLDRSSITAAEWPAASRALTMWLPMNPAPPVTRTCMCADP